MKNKLKKIKFEDAVPFIAFIVIFVFFALASYNDRTGKFMMLTARNLSTLVEQTMLTLIVACGTLFVTAQGSTDLSVGVNLALAATIGSYLSLITGIAWLLIPVCIVVGLVMGLLNGWLLSKLKVSSFMLTLSMLIGIRGLVNYLQTFTGVQKIPEGISFLTDIRVRIILFVIILAIMWYVFEYTKMGRYSRAIGENETTAKFVGVPVGKMKILAFVLSGLMVGIGAVFNIATVGATSNQMGSFLEIRVVMGIYLGGVLVTGGSSAKFYKILLGCFSIQTIVIGLALMGKSDAFWTQSVQGVLLLVILFLTALASRRRGKKSDKLSAAEVEATAEAVEANVE